MTQLPANTLEIRAIDNNRATARRDPADILTFGFGTSVAMWAVGYFGRLPIGDGVMLPNVVLLTVFIGCMVGAGFLAARYLPNATARLWKAGLITAALNLLVLGSVIGRETPKEMMRAAALWVPMLAIVTIALMYLGHAIGKAISSKRADSPRDIDWRCGFAVVLVGATTVMLALGGAVTGFEAGLAVVDWPNSFGYNMFLYPLTKMTGGIYYEHAHRLFGTLVGLTTLALAIYLQRYEERRGLRTFGWGLFLLVCVQGVLGGLRVTGHFTLSQSEAEVAPSIALAVVHGVLGQIFFANLVAMAVFVSRRWKTMSTRLQNVVSDSPIAAFALVIAIVLQIILGAVFRHLGLALSFHVVFAFFVLGLAFFVGYRAWLRDESVPVLPKLGGWLMMTASAQLALGVLALIGVMMRRGAATPPALEVILTTAHQTFGAILLAVAVAFACWAARSSSAQSTVNVRSNEQTVAMPANS